MTIDNRAARTANGGMWAFGPLVILIGALWGLAVVWFLDRRLRRLDLPAYDTAYFQQLVWGITHGQLFHASFLPGNFLGLHFSPLLVAPALFEVLVPGTQALNLIAALALGAITPACFLACREVLPRTSAGLCLAIVLSVAVLLSPPMQEAVWSGFHTEEIALPLVFVASWAALRGHTKLALATLIVALMAKEDLAYQGLVLGVLLLMVPGRRRLGAWVAGGSLAWGFVVLAVVMPWLRQGAVTDTGGYYAWLTSGGPSAVFTSTRLVHIFSAVVDPAAWRSVALTLLALCLLPLLRPRFALLALPPLLAALLSGHQPQPHLQLQYGLPLVFPLAMAGALGGRRLLESRQLGARAVGLAVIPGLLVGLSGSLAAPMASLLADPGPDRVAQIDRAMASVPSGAEVDVDDSVAAAVASRANLRLLPHASPAAFILVDRGRRPPAYVDAAARDRVVAELSATRARLWSDGRIELWGPRGHGGLVVGGNQRALSALLKPT